PRESPGSHAIPGGRAWWWVQSAPLNPAIYRNPSGFSHFRGGLDSPSGAGWPQRGGMFGLSTTAPSAGSSSSPASFHASSPPPIERAFQPDAANASAAGPERLPDRQ